MLEPIRERYRLPALPAAVVHADGTCEVGATGVRRLGAATLVTGDDRWHLGSNTKGVTATLVARLVEHGKMRWTSTVQEVLGARVEIDRGYRDVTIEQLLAHSGGVPHDFGARPFWRRFRAAEEPSRMGRLALVARLLHAPPAYAAGTRQAYSNAGLVVAGAMAEEVTSRGWEGLVAVEVLEPLGITSFGFGAPGTQGTLDQPWGHRDGVFGLVPVPPGRAADNPPAVGPSGALHMSLADYGRFLAAHLAGERGESAILRGETFRRMHDDGGRPDYGLGWGVRHDRECGNVLVHTGSNGRWLHLVWASLDRGVGIVIASSCASPAADQATREALEALRGARAAPSPPWLRRGSRGPGGGRRRGEGRQVPRAARSPLQPHHGAGCAVR